jgi:hypothetical protein
MSILNWFTKKKHFKAYDPQQQVNNLIAQLNHFSLEMEAERELVMKRINDVALTPKDDGILKGYLFGLIFAGEILEGNCQWQVYKKLQVSEDFAIVWQELSRSNRPYMPAPPASAIEKVNPLND